VIACGRLSHASEYQEADLINERSATALHALGLIGKIQIYNDAWPSWQIILSVEG
jgi:hypothetical protein